MVKTAKVGVLLFLVIQTLFLDVLPISPDPTAPRIIGLGLFHAGLTIAILGRVQLGNNWKDAEELASAQTPSLTTNGIYRFIRHPIYGGDMLLLLGLELALNSWLVLAMVVPILVFARVAIAEEGSLADKFADYAAYRQHTKRFIPFVI